MKTLYTLCVDGYAPEITALTFPLMRRWAQKIRADFHVIETRRWPDLPPVYEKLQIYDLSRERGDDWSLYIDADALVHPDTFDPTNHLPRDTVMHNGCDMAGNRWAYDDAGYFQRDGRHIGSCNWFTVASRWCRDLWHPLEDLTFAEALAHIYPIQHELNSGFVKPEHLIDDYVLSRNIARYGLKFVTFLEIQAKLGQGDQFNYFWHQYGISEHEKLHGRDTTDAEGRPKHELGLRDMIARWGVEGSP